MGKEKTLSKSRTMAPRMVANFRRSLSFPNHPNHSTKLKKTFHVRSASLPCRSHPLISQLKDDLNELKSLWADSKPETRTCGWVCDGLNQLKSVHESLDDLLQLPQTRESLHGYSDLVEKLLDDFLHFVDVYGIFQSLILSFKEEHLAAQVAIRRKDETKIASYAKALRKMAKEMDKLVSNVQCIGKYIVPQQSIDGDDAELAQVMKDVIEVTQLVSIALFNGLGVSIMALPKPTCSWITNKKKKLKEEDGILEFVQMGLETLLWGNLRKKGDDEVKMVSKKMHELEDCISGIGNCGEKVFRSLINTRVSLLNVFTQ